ncbi:MAG: 2-oxoacid:acceptor oxidoreductase subunit alpha [Candidatus Brocadiales bacterium]
MNKRLNGNIPPGEYFWEGNEAVAEAAIRAGCRFFAGYPISPSSEIMERLSYRLPEVGGIFIQMEDEIASLGAVIGAVWAGAKAMTATSGPGLSLMAENIGYAVMTETPCVIVDVQRAGPSTGQATRPYSGDMMQVRWCSGTDYQIIALSPWSVQEMYGLTVEAFNLAETYRVPVFIMSDAAIAHLREICTVPGAVTVSNRRKLPNRPHFGTDDPGGVPPMASFGEGEALLITGSTHDEFGYRRTQDPNTQKKLVTRLNEKILRNADKIIQTEEYLIEDADVVVVAYGIAARAALKAIKQACDKGIKAGLLRLKTVWPFPEHNIRNLKAKRILVPEMNRGQIAQEVERFARADVETISITRVDGEVITSGEILEPIMA